MKKRKLLSIMLLVCFLVGVSGTLTSCKDYDDDAGWKEKFETDNRTLTDALNTQIATLQQSLATCQNNCKTRMDELEGKINTLNGNLTTLNNELTEKINSKADTAQITALKTEITNTNNRITILQGTMESIQKDLEEKIRKGDSILNAANEAQQRDIDANTGAIKANKDSIAKLQGELADAINKNNQTIADINGKITVINQTLTTVQNDIKDINTSISNLSTRLGDLEGRVTSIETTIGEIKTNINTITTDLTNLTTNFSNFKTYVENQFVAYDTKFADLYAKAAADSAAILQARSIADEADSIAKAAIDSATAVSGEVARVKDLANQNAAAISALQNRVSSLEALVNKIEEALRKQVTSIAVNGTYNPIFGSYTIPSGDVRSTVLGTYYGKFDEFQFPTAISAYYANTASVLTNKDIETANASKKTIGGGTVVSEDGAAGNAGKIYLTLNPTEVDFTGKAFSLVNSRGAESAMLLTNTQPSDELLQFGYTRAAGSGLYESQATVSKDAVDELKPNVNLNDIKEEVRTLYHNWKNRSTNGGMRVDLSQLAGVIYENVNNVLPALALKTSWITTDTANVEHTHSVLSQYSVAAAAVHPLSFGFLQNRTFTPLPLYTAYEDINVQVDTVTVSTVDPKDHVVTVTVTMQDGSKQTYTADGINELIDSYNNALLGIQSQVNNQIRDIDSQLDQLSRLTRLFKTYDRWANRVNGWFSRDGNNNINRSLQPVLFYGAGNELRKLGNTKFATAALPSGSSLLATSYTLELLAPAYEKWIAVTNAWPTSNDAIAGTNSAQQGNAAALAAVGKANSGENMNSVVFGTTRHVTLGTLEKNYVYEISFAAVDYSGKVSVRKFYVRGE